MTIPTGVTFIWPGTHATIPASWVRETALDGRYVKGTAAGVNPNVTGGATTHSHSAAASHSHTMAAHTHSITLGNVGTLAGRAGGNNIAADHGHSAHNSGAASGGGLSSVAATYASLSNDPAYYTVIFIKPSGWVNGLPESAICFFDSSDTKGLTFCNGSNSTPDLRNRFLKGASTGANGGATGGSTTNVHTLTHTHTVAGHTHAAVTSPATAPGGTDGWGGVTTGAWLNGGLSHTHSTSLNSTTATLTGSVSLTTAETVEPAYSKLVPAQNRTGGVTGPLGMIGMWLGTLANIPAGWAEVTGMRGKYLKGANLTSETGTTGGSNTHTHAAQNHTHTGVAHTHSATSSQHRPFDDPTQGQYYSSAPGVIATAVHPVTAPSVTATYANGSTSASSSSNEPAYTTVAFIKFEAHLVAESESITATDSINTALTSLTNVSDTATTGEHSASNISAGGDRVVSIWRDSVAVSEDVDFPGDRDASILDDETSVSESLAVRIVTEEQDTYKPRLRVDY